MHRLVTRLYRCACLLAAALLMVPSPARAQYQPRPLNDPATGEKYHIEASAGLWFPAADVVVSSAGFGIQGSAIDLKKDFSLQDLRFKELQLVLRPTKASKLRFQYIPVKYEVTATLQRPIVFNGIRYNPGVPATATLDWKAMRVGYEFDFVSRNSGYLGVVFDVKYTDVFVQLKGGDETQFTKAKAPIPAIGGIARIYLVPNISVTGEMTGFSLKWLPDSLIKNNSGHYVDLDLYGTLNFTNSVGVRIGYRSLDVGYVANTDTGALTLKGLYFGLVARY